MPYTPAWQEPITGVPGAAVARIAREFADNAERSGGRSMILMGAGTQPLVPLRHHLPRHAHPHDADWLSGRQRRRLAHYVGQGEVPPGDRLGAPGLRAGLSRPPRQMIGHRVLVHPHTTSGATTSTAPTC
ncbi:hypothetical protein GCM10020358_35680 [Amorphoplanes nipponensis]